jgi:uncharacterized protein GlcG (DUF336 family)
MGLLRSSRWIAFLLIIVFGAPSCLPEGKSSGSSSGAASGTSSGTGGPYFLAVADSQKIIAQAVAESLARGSISTIAVVDRLGNVLGVFRMNGADTTIEITSGRGVTSGLEGAMVPDTLAAIAKAVTGAYLSSGGNAFTSRTANQIVQEHFNPKETEAPGGPLFGVQFSQLPCSDLSVRFASGMPQAFIGPKRSPLGLAADPGGLPLYVDDVLVGAIGVISDGTYGLDLDISNVDIDDDELIALAGTFGFEAPITIRANHITVEGKTLRFADSSTADLISDPNAAPSFASITGGVEGNVVTVTGYNDGPVVTGKELGNADSGIRTDVSGAFGALNAFVLVDGSNVPRFPPTAGTEGGADDLTQAEVTTILTEALSVAFRARAQIRRPLGSHAQVTISVVDTNGAVLGVVRTPDAPVFGTDVSLQKARTAAFFSNTVAAADLNAAGASISAYVDNVQTFVGGTALTDGIAFSDRAGGNLSRPFYPDGIDGNANGPFSRAFADWSPFSTGLQLDLVVGNLLEHLDFVTGASGTDTVARCTGLPLIMATGSSRIANGIQIFPGSVPIFRNATVIGGIGVSGDGIDQDDLISFLGLHNAGVVLGTGVGNAPVGVRADTLSPQGTLLRYVNCPFSPFLDTNEQNVCAGK